MTSGIVSTPDTLAGKPRVAGTRISVALILEELAGGVASSEVASEPPPQ